MTVQRAKETDQPLISVIMPCYNAETLIGESIESVKAQTHQNFELIIVDDGSKDGSLKVLEQYAATDDRIVLVTQDNKGAGPARNRGLHEAQGEYIAFLDSDDYWEKKTLSTLLDALRITDADLAYCGWQNVGTQEKRSQPYIPPDYTHEGKLAHLLSTCPWPIHAALTKTSAINSVGGFDETLSSCMDYDLWLKIGTQYSITLVPEVMAYYRHHDNEQITKDIVRIAKNHFLVQQNYIQNNPDIIATISKKKIRDLTLGELLHRGYIAYWKRDLHDARAIFKQVMKHGYGNPCDWKYMLPSILPYRVHNRLISIWKKK